VDRHLPVHAERSETAVLPISVLSSLSTWCDTVCSSTGGREINPLTKRRGEKRRSILALSGANCAFHGKFFKLNDTLIPKS
jgi:hypothetical protein